MRPLALACYASFAVTVLGITWLRYDSPWAWSKHPSECSDWNACAKQFGRSVEYVAADRAGDQISVHTVDGDGRWITFYLTTDQALILSRDLRTLTDKPH